MKDFTPWIRIFICAGLLICLVACGGHTTAEEPSPFSGPYLGQSPPGMRAGLFGAGVLSTEMYELNAVFFPGGKEVIFSVGAGPMRWALVMAREEEGQWSAPEIAPFSGKFGGVDPFVSRDGNTVYFCSNRPRPGNTEAETDYDLWYVTRIASGWSEAVNMGAPINSDTHEFYPTLTRDGTLYFQSRRPGGLGQSDIYRAQLIGGQYPEVEHLPEPINSPGFEGDAFIAPDESYIILSTSSRADSIGSADLYISFRSPEDTWSALTNMGGAVNSKGGENCQMLSPCGRYLFFTSRRWADFEKGIPDDYAALRRRCNTARNGFGDAYWIDAKIIEQFRPKN